jgi:hypothetical protein
VGKVDVTENRAIGSRFDIKGFPTIKFFHKGEVYPFKGARSKEGFLGYVKGGYAEVGGEQTPTQPEWSEMMIRSVTDPFKKAMKDVENVSIIILFWLNERCHSVRSDIDSFE